MILRQQGCGAAEQVTAAGTSPRANARRPADARRARAVLADRAPAIVERAELREVRPRLLEVVAEDLLELGAAVAVDLVRPRRRTARGGRLGRA